MFLYEKINSKNQTIVEKKSAAKLIQNPIMKKFIVRIKSPIVVRLAVYKFKIVLSRHTSLNCGSRINPNMKLTTAITISWIFGLWPNKSIIIF